MKDDIQCNCQNRCLAGWSNKFYKMAWYVGGRGEVMCSALGTGIEEEERRVLLFVIFGQPSAP